IACLRLKVNQRKRCAFLDMRQIGFGIARYEGFLRSMQAGFAIQIWFRWVHRRFSTPCPYGPDQMFIIESADMDMSCDETVELSLEVLFPAFGQRSCPERLPY